eukprot:CAMPEP_0182925978 /NCGR_PEP_ID=MMETSP0105_2-20130417/10761_1 /TAXON_ID=81532 ORGANISM="Acanthoeca-like sp., Strain 10tr" /NCGR_SAMPLE_ID=MMETSP0105_2 /ASSEMBLY_ACC=CAM_ASM_000205 /LENGTH=345 /DNA_ID=CAMNT_0025063849 /DNA_START=44 /DNA_END=1081 /DNA_ORIENTATION=+
MALFDGKPVLVTGGAGYIGSHTVVEMVSAGIKPVILDNLVNAKEAAIARVEEITKTKIEFRTFDLLDKAALDALFKEFDFGAVIHFAGLKAVGESTKLPLRYYDNNLTGTINLLQVMGDHNVKNLVFSSSATVYGDPIKLPIDEEHQVGVGVTNPYGKTKYFIEEMCRDLGASDPEWNIVLLRYFNPIGAHKSGRIGEDPAGIPNNLVPYIAQVAVGRREHLSIFGDDYDTVDGTGVRDYIHVVDLALGHVAALKRSTEKCGCTVYNLGSGKGYSVKQVVAAFSKACGKELPVKMAPRRPGDIAACYADASKAERELGGWKCTRDIDEMCADGWRWQSNNPNGFE